MTKVTCEVHIDVPKDKAWRVLSGFSDVQDYNPSVKKSYSTSDKSTGLGATRHCDLTLFGATVEEEIIDWKEGEEYWISIYGGQKAPPFSKAIAQLGVKDDGKGGTIAIGMFEYKLKFGPIGFLMDQFMVKPQFEKAFPRLLAGFKHYCETGETVDGDTKINLEAVTVVN